MIEVSIPLNVITSGAAAVCAATWGGIIYTTIYLYIHSSIQYVSVFMYVSIHLSISTYCHHWSSGSRRSGEWRRRHRFLFDDCAASRAPGCGQGGNCREQEQTEGGLYTHTHTFTCHCLLFDDCAADPATGCKLGANCRGKEKKGESDAVFECMYLYIICECIYIYIYIYIYISAIAPPTAPSGAAAASGPAGGPPVEKKRRGGNGML